MSKEPLARALLQRAWGHGVHNESNTGEVMAGKVYPDAKSALDGIPFDGMAVMAGGFGLSGNPENLIAALRENGVKDITIISNNCGADNRGLWVLLENG